MTFNINEEVKIRLRPLGISIYRDHYAQVARMLDCPIGPTVDADGWTKMQLWMVMKIFGPYIYVTGEPPFDPTIELIRGDFEASCRHEPSVGLMAQAGAKPANRPPAFSYIEPTVTEWKPHEPLP